MKNKKLFMMFLALTLVVGCAKVDTDQLGEPVAEGELANMKVDFTVSAEQLVGGPGQIGGPDSYSIAPGDGVQEGTGTSYSPKDVWVFQYAGTADNSKLVGLPRYVDLTNSGGKIQAVASTVTNTLVFVANTHSADVEWGNIVTLGGLRDDFRAIASERDCYSTSADKDLMFSGKWEGIVNTGVVTASLYRNIARIDFTITNSTGSGITLQTIQLCDVSSQLHYASGMVGRSVIFPAKSEYISYPAEPITTASAANGGSQSFVFYAPINQKGTNMASTDSKTKPNHAPTRSTYIRVVGADAKDKSYAYRFYPGANMINDYNLSPNHRYQITVSINSAGDASTDGRVENYGELNMLSANSYIINPASAGTADRVFTIPIGRLNDFWKEVDPTYTIGHGDQWTAELLWQDAPNADFIRFVTDLDDRITATTMSGTGPNARIAVTTKATYQGNAVVGIKKVGHETAGYIWSWHLWVTDYNPEFKEAFVNGQFVYGVPGGHVHQYGGDHWLNPTMGRYRNKMMMDRNLGSRSVERGTQGAVFYQFGRKDPFPMVDNGNVLYDILGVALDATNELNAAKKNVATASGETFAMGIMHPTYFYSKGGADWCSEGKLAPHPWNNPVPGIENKSLFDPCPAGWKTPESDVWSEFSYSPSTPALSTTIDVGRDPQLGWSYGGTNGIRYWPKNSVVAGSIYYPVHGYKNGASGAMAGLTTEMWTWSATPSTNINSNGNRGLASSTVRTGTARSNGMQVRCVKE